MNDDANLVALCVLVQRELEFGLIVITQKVEVTDSVDVRVVSSKRGFDPAQVGRQFPIQCGGFSLCGNIEGKRAESADTAALRRFTWHGARVGPHQSSILRPSNDSFSDQLAIAS